MNSIFRDNSRSPVTPIATPETTKTTLNPVIKPSADPEKIPIPSSYKELYLYYGNPQDSNFKNDYIVTIKLEKQDGGTWEIECHKEIANKLRAVWQELKISDNLRLIKTYDGCFNVRMKRGKNELSIHSWGLAIDVNASEYPLGSLKKQPEGITRAFRNQGFSWGGDWKSRKDPMHYEFSHSGI